jgi:secreted trypsin-like serine protease
MIVAGTEAAEGKFPYQVRLYSSIEDDGGFCGGSLIAPQWVLTALTASPKATSMADRNAGRPRGRRGRLWLQRPHKDD